MWSKIKCQSSSPQQCFVPLNSIYGDQSLFTRFYRELHLPRLCDSWRINYAINLGSGTKLNFKGCLHNNSKVKVHYFTPESDTPPWVWGRRFGSKPPWPRARRFRSRPPRPWGRSFRSRPPRIWGRSFRSRPPWTPWQWGRNFWSRPTHENPVKPPWLPWQLGRRNGEKPQTSRFKVQMLNNFGSPHQHFPHGEHDSEMIDHYFYFQILKCRTEEQFKWIIEEETRLLYNSMQND